jgi:hypothetical protein
VHTNLDAVARLGQLHLDDGLWDGRRILPEGWVAQASAIQIANPQREDPDWRQGYGFQFWRSQHGYRGDGAYGQYMVVLPEADAVVAITSQSLNMQTVLDALWRHLLPALTAQGQVPSGPWTPGPLTLAGPASSTTSTSGRRPASGPASIIGSHFTPRIASDASWLRSVDVRGEHLMLTDGEGELTLALGVPGDWTATGCVFTDHHWDQETLQVDIIFAETPHRLILRLDPSTHEFTAQWPAEPLHRLPLAHMRMPQHDS